MRKKTRKVDSMIYTIIGRVGSGKTKMLSELETIGIKNITVNEIKKTTDTVAMIASPESIKKITQDNPESIFKIIYIKADDMERKFNAVKHEEKKIEAEEQFDRKDEDEDFEFCEFEEKIDNKENNNDWIPDNVAGIYIYENDFSENRIKEYANFIKFEITYQNEITEIVKKLIEADIIKTKENDKNKVLVMTTNDTEKEVSLPYFVDMVSENEHFFYMTIRAYIMLRANEKISS